MFSSPPVRLTALPLPSFHDTYLAGKEPFWSQCTYKAHLTKDFKAHLAPVVYSCETEPKTHRIAKQLLSYLIFPTFLYQTLHHWVGRNLVIPACDPKKLGYASEYVQNRHTEFNRSYVAEKSWKYQRIAIEVDGLKIDATVVGQATTLNNGRWTLKSNGNAEFYEDGMRDPSFLNLLQETESNALVFNYPGVGASEGPTSKSALIKAYQAMLSFLENSVEAREIIGYGHSIGGAVQAEALNGWTFKEGVRYVFVKSRTFSLLSTVPSSLITKYIKETGSPLAKLAEKIVTLAFRCLTYLLGWQMDVAKSSKALTAPELILQTAILSDGAKYYEMLDEVASIEDDGVISIESSLANALLEEKNPMKGPKTILGIGERHNEPLRSPEKIAEQIQALLWTQ